MNDLIFLPDREGRDVLTDATGFVRLGRDESALRDLADRLVVRKTAAAAANTAAWRGTLALALLADVWADADARLTVMTVDAATSLFAAWVLAARPASARRDAVHLVLLEARGTRRLLGIADPQCGVMLPATPTDFTGVLTARARWYDEETGQLSDPLPYLSEMDRDILQKRIRLMGLDSAEVAAFVADLAAVGHDEADAIRASDEHALRRLYIRMQAVHGLTDFASFEAVTEPYALRSKNELMACFGEQDITEKDLHGTSYTYLWDGIEFARTDRRIGLADTCDPEQEDALSRMETEINLLAEQSVAWSRNTARSLGDWLTANRLMMMPDVRTQGDTLHQALSEAGRQVQGAVTLAWPWDASGGAVRRLLQEALGDGWMEAASAPFSDRLTKLTGHVLGDTALQTCCACADGVLLPPLSRKMAMCVANAEDGTGLAMDALRFQPREDGGITASFLLRGMGEVVMQRVYPADEMTVLSEEETPTVAVWPCIPLANWKAYHVFTRGGAVQAETLRDGSWLPSPTFSSGWNCLRTERYPACLMLTQGPLCLGALPNLLPACHIDATGDAVAAIDLGTATTHVVLSLDGQITPLPQEQRTRLLVMPDQMPADDFLRSLTPRATVPTAVDLIGSGSELFIDGQIFCAGNVDALEAKPAAEIKSALKWRADEKSVRARRLLMQQVMQGAAFSAMVAGARSITWKVSVADEMDDEGRQVTVAMMDELAQTVAKRTGLPLTAGKPPVLWAEEAVALCAYLRGDGGVRGSFAALDMGSVSTKLHLWMQGQGRPAAGAVLLEGTLTMLLDALRAKPEILPCDFADCPDEEVQFAMQALGDQLAVMDASLAEHDKAQLMLQTILDDYQAPLAQHLLARLTAQRPTYTQAILLENQAAMMFVAGLMLEQVGADTMRNHLLPEDMTIALTGRGAWLMGTLAPAQRNALQQIARRVMRLDNPVRFISLKAADHPSTATARGMAATRDTGIALNTPVIRTRESFSQLMQAFMVDMVTHYPLHTWLLHEGLFDAWGQLTPAGQETIIRVAARCYGAGEDIPASVMAFVKELRITPITQENAATFAAV